MLRKDLAKASEKIEKLMREIERDKKEAQRREIQIEKAADDCSKAIKDVEDSRANTGKVKEALDVLGKKRAEIEMQLSTEKVCFQIHLIRVESAART